jgi:hypothetical protein
MREVVANHIKILLNWYELEGKSQIGEEEMQGLSIEDILSLFDAPFWNGLYQCWAVETQHVAALQPHIGHIIEPHRYAYFIETINLAPQQS